MAAAAASACAILSRPCSTRSTRAPTLELDGVDKKVYWDVVDHCYLCDMCFMTKCPYVPPHPWNIDFPHLMLRAKHVQHRKGEHSFPRQTTVEHARARQHRRHSGGGRDRQRGQRHQGAAASCSRPRSASTPRAPIPKFHSNTGSNARAANSRARRTRSEADRRRRAARSRCSSPATAIATSRTCPKTSPRCSSTTASR